MIQSRFLPVVSQRLVVRVAARAAITQSTFLRHTIDIGEDQTLVVRADIFNLLNNDRVTEVNEIYDDESSADPTNPDVNPNYGLPTAWQTPRYVRFSVNYSF